MSVTRRGASARRARLTAVIVPLKPPPTMAMCLEGGVVIRARSDAFPVRKLNHRRQPILGTSAGDRKFLHLPQRRGIDVERHEILAGALQVGNLVGIVILGGAHVALM